MSLGISEIKRRANAFSLRWQDETSERAEAQSFWNEFFSVFGVDRRKVASFEAAIQRRHGTGFADLLWPGCLIAEHKSAGQSLDNAATQAMEYMSGLRDRDLPQYLVVCNFSKFVLYDLLGDSKRDIPLSQLADEIEYFLFIAGYSARTYKDADPVNIEAAQKITLLHDKLAEDGYDGHQLEVFLVRIVFLLFADHTGIFEVRWHFRWLLENNTYEDGRETGRFLSEIFDLLDQKPENRQHSLEPDLARLPYINGSLFTERFPIPVFNPDLQSILLDCCGVDWSSVSPAIFGSLFQGLRDTAERREKGSHFTSEKNIRKVVDPLFMDALRREFNEIVGSNARTTDKAKSLNNFHLRLSTLKFLDPACGCGNFLVVAYRELRLLEIDVVEKLLEYEGRPNSGLLSLELRLLVNVNQMFGIEIDEWPARISELALWVTDHQVNMEAGRRFGDSLIRLPLKASPTIRNDNALRISWNSVVPNEELFCIFGNPPFKGKQYRTPEQRQDMALTFQYAIDQDRAHGQALSRDGGTLDYVSCWYVIAAEYIRGTRIRVGFVSTNSITQGEQVGPLWSFMRDRGMIIHFAHRTFKWTNEVKNAAAVFCVIITFANFDTDRKFIAEYETPTSEPQIRYVPQINGYLINFPHMFLTRRTTPLCEVAAIAFGSMPNDDGALLLDEAERASLLSRYPRAAQFVRLCLGSKEYFSGRQRWCLWLVGVSPSTYRTIPEVMSRIRRVKQHRRESKRLQTQNLADTPHQFGEVRHTGEPYLLIPKVCSENRRYMPLSLMPGDVIVTDLCFEMPNATLWQFAILSSSMHMDWMRAVCGRLKGDYRYSAQFVYNNFPWPPRTSAALRRRVEQAATSLLAIRHRHQASGNTLADLYDPLAMPSDLTEAHHRLDRAVERCYLVAQRTGLGSESERVEHLFGLYLSLV